MVLFSKYYLSAGQQVRLQGALQKRLKVAQIRRPSIASVGDLAKKSSNNKPSDVLFAHDLKPKYLGVNSSNFYREEKCALQNECSVVFSCSKAYIFRRAFNQFLQIIITYSTVYTSLSRELCTVEYVQCRETKRLLWRQL